MKRIEEVALNYVGKNRSEIDGRYPNVRGGAWCAATVCCELDDCGIDVFKSISCTTMANAWANDPRMQRVQLDDIQSGDIIFFDKFDEVDGDCDHVAIVVAYDGNVNTGLYYVDGNGGSDGTNTVLKHYMDYPTLQRCAARIFRYIGDQNVTTASENVTIAQENVSDQGGSGDITFDQLQRGSKGKSVKILQALLIAAGYSCGPCSTDGDFGGATEGAVTTYQREKGLSPDGIVGPLTWASLLS